MLDHQLKCANSICEHECTPLPEKMNGDFPASIILGPHMCGKTRVVLEVVRKEVVDVVSPAKRPRHAAFYLERDCSTFLSTQTTVVVAFDTQMWISEMSRWTPELRVAIAPRCGFESRRFFTALVATGKGACPHIILMHRSDASMYFKHALIMFGSGFKFHRLVFDDADVACTWTESVAAITEDDSIVSSPWPTVYTWFIAVERPCCVKIDDPYYDCVFSFILEVFRDQKRSDVREIEIDYTHRFSCPLFWCDTIFCSSHQMLQLEDAATICKSTSIALETGTITEEQATMQHPCRICLDEQPKMCIVHELCMNGTCRACFTKMLEVAASDEEDLEKRLRCPVCRRYILMRDCFNTQLDDKIDTLAKLARSDNLVLEGAIPYPFTEAIAVVLAHFARNGTLHHDNLYDDRSSCGIVWIVMNMSSQMASLSERLATLLPADIQLPRFLVTITTLTRAKNKRFVIPLDVIPDITHVLAVGLTLDETIDYVNNSLAAIDSDSLSKLRLYRIETLNSDDRHDRGDADDGDGATWATTTDASEEYDADITD